MCGWVCTCECGWWEVLRWVGVCVGVGGGVEWVVGVCVGVCGSVEWVVGGVRWVGVEVWSGRWEVLDGCVWRCGVGGGRC